MLLQNLRHWHKDAGRKNHIKETISLFPALQHSIKPLLQCLKCFIPPFMARYVGASIAASLELFCKPWRSDDVDEIFMAHMAWGKADDLEIIW